MANKPAQYKIVRYGNGYGIVGRHTNRWVTTGALKHGEAKDLLIELEAHTNDTPESYQGYYGG